MSKKVVDQEIDKRAEEKKKEIEMAPVFHTVKEVKSIEIGSIREIKLSVPKKYKLDNRNRT